MHQIDSNRQLYAQWTANTYTIKYNSNDGSGTMEDTAVTYGVSTKLRKNTFTKTGYHFSGWYAYRHSDELWYYSNANDDRGWWTLENQPDGYSLYLYKDENSISKTSPVNGDTITMYAQWTINTYTIKYNANGGSGTMADTIATYGESTKLRKNTFVKTNYKFKGWHAYRHSDELWYYVNENDDREWYKLNEQENGYSLYLYKDEGTALRTTPINGDTITMYAHWELDVATITYNGNGNIVSNIPIAQTSTIGSTVQLSLTNPTRTRYNFLGWSTNASATSATYTPGANFTISADTTLYAVWQLQDKTIWIYNTGKIDAVDFIVVSTFSELFDTNSLWPIVNLMFILT